VFLINWKYYLIDYVDQLFVIFLAKICKNCIHYFSDLVDTFCGWILVQEIIVDWLLNRIDCCFVKVYLVELQLIAHNFQLIFFLLNSFWTHSKCFYQKISFFLLIFYMIIEKIFKGSVHPPLKLILKLFSIGIKSW